MLDQQGRAQTFVLSMQVVHGIANFYQITIIPKVQTRRRIVGRIGFQI
jgi:hypothetical protein